MDFRDSYVTFHPQTAGYTFFLTADETFSKISYMLGKKANHCIYKKI